MCSWKLASRTILTKKLQDFFFFLIGGETFFVTKVGKNKVRSSKLRKFGISLFLFEDIWFLLQILCLFGRANLATSGVRTVGNLARA
jgi:hypothetical protein